MSYIVLARKHRPQTFDEVVGQEHIIGLLKKALQSDRLTHAYLFCGPRGIGKTSCARILAKSLNCEKGPTLTPCGACAACQEIARGTSFDVLEIDGASNRGIDEIRALRENVKFAPGYGRYKIYIVDEVHMLTTEAFNALLKTLEEPPAHVKFIFATTAPQKVPGTIISRCQRFDFKRAPIKKIVDLLTDVSRKENLKVSPEALYAIGKSAQGSLRDALSILDQLSALNETGINAEDVSSMLGLVEIQYLFDLADALGRKDCPKSLEVLECLMDRGKDIKQLAQDLTEHFRHLMVIKIGGKALGHLVDYPGVLKEMISKQLEQFTLKEILEVIDGLIKAQEDARVTESVRMALEIAFAKMTYQGEGALPAKADGKADAGADRAFSAPHILKDNAGQIRTFPDPAPASRETAVSDPVLDKDIEEDASSEGEPVEDLEDLAARDFGNSGAEDAVALDLHKIKKVWDVLTHAVSREKMSAATYLQEGVAYEFSGHTLAIGFAPKCRFQKEALEAKANAALVERVFAHVLKAPLTIKYVIVEDCEPREEPEDVKKVLNVFQGTVIHRWHEEKNA